MTYNQAIKDRPFGAGPPLLRSSGPLSRRWYDSPCQVGHDDS